jgi:hypothetical protein
MISLNLTEMRVTVEKYNDWLIKLDEKIEKLKQIKIEMNIHWEGNKAEESMSRLNKLITSEIDESLSKCSIITGQIHFVLRMLLDELSKQKVRCDKFLDVVEFGSGGIVTNNEAINGTGTFMLDYEIVSRMINEMGFFCGSNVSNMKISWQRLKEDFYRNLYQSSYNIKTTEISGRIASEIEKAETRIEIYQNNLNLCLTETKDVEEEAVRIFNEYTDEFAKGFNRSLYITNGGEISVDRICYLAGKDAAFLTEKEIKEWNEFIKELEEKTGSRETAIEYLAENYLLKGMNVTQVQIDNMQEYGYSFWELYCFVATAETPIEREFLDSIMNREYIKLDKISSNSLGIGVYVAVADYSYRLIKLNKHDEFKDFTNGVLGVGVEPYPNTENVLGHLENLHIASDYILYQKQGDYVGYNEKTEEEKRQLIIDTEKAIAVSAWWNDIYTHVEDGDIKFRLVGEKKDWVSLEVKDMLYDETTGNISYSYNYTNKEGSFGELFSVETELLSRDSSNIEKHEIHVQALERKIAGLRGEYNRNAVKIVVGNIPFIGSLISGGGAGAVVDGLVSGITGKSYGGVPGAAANTGTGFVANEIGHNQKSNEMENYRAEYNHLYGIRSGQTIAALVESVYSTTTAGGAKTYTLEVIRGEISPASMITNQELRDNGISGMFSDTQLGTLEYLESISGELSDIERALLWGEGDKNEGGRTFVGLTQAEYNRAVKLIEERVGQGIDNNIVENAVPVRIGNIIENKVMTNVANVANMKKGK